MIVIGAVVWGAVLFSYAILVAGLVRVARSFSRAHTHMDPRLFTSIEVLLNTVVGTLIVAPAVCVAVYCPISFVSPLGTSGRALFKPRLVDRLDTAIYVSYAASGAIALSVALAYSIYKRKRHVNR